MRVPIATKGSRLRCLAEGRSQRPEIPNGVPSETLVSRDVRTKMPNGKLRGSCDKSEVVVVRMDGISCTRERVAECGSLYFEGTSTHQHVLMWKTRPSCVLVVKKMGNTLLNEVIIEIDGEEDMDVLLEPDLYHQCRERYSSLQHRFYGFDPDNCQESKLMYGVLLHAAHLFKTYVPPMVAFTLGSLSFLTAFDFKNFKHAISDMIYGALDREDTSVCQIPDCFSAGVLVTLRMRLLCEIYKRDEGKPVRSYECLNEIVIDRGASPYLTNIECYENERLITRVQADGIMLATPTGSTAYSVAAGGSMVHPHVSAILLTPICPHSLTFRPVILPDYAVIELRVAEGTRGDAWVSCDGRDRQVIECGDRVCVRMSQHPVPTVTCMDQTMDWFNSLERCFGWNERVEQQPIDTSASTSSPSGNSQG